MSTIRKSVTTAIAFAMLATAGAIVPVSQANAGGYGYYNEGNGYYPSCRYIKIAYKWDYYGRPIAWRKVRHCS